MSRNVGKKTGPLSLTTILTVSFILLCVVALFVSSAVQIIVFLEAQQKTVKGKQELIARDAKSAVIGFIEEKHRVLSAAVDLAGIGSAPRDRQQLTVMSILGQEPYFRNLVLLDPQGRVLVGGSHISRSDTQRFVSSFSQGAVLEAMKKNDVFIGDVYIDSYTSEPLAVISVIGRDAYKDVQCILAAELNLKFMWELIDQVKVGETAEAGAFVVDRKGTLIAFRDTSRVLKGENVTGLRTVAEFLKSAAAAAQMEFWRYRGIAGVEVVGTFLPLGKPDWAVVVELPVAEAYREITISTTIAVGITFVMALLGGIIGAVLARRLSVPLINLTKTAAAIAAGDSSLEARVAGSKETAALAETFNIMTGQLRQQTEKALASNRFLSRVVSVSRDIVSNLNATAREIEAAAQEQTTAANEHASGITEVSATLQELSVTARQITNNVGELVLSSEEVVKTLKESEQQLLGTVSRLDEVGQISRRNSNEIVELGKRSVLINEMVELIKEVANKTNILSINASIEASRAGEAGSGFSVVAAEIRELSKETIESAKKAEKAAKEIRSFLDSIVVAAADETAKVVESGTVVKGISRAMAGAVAAIGNNYNFTQKIDVSIKQQETGSIQAAETMRQMAEISRQSAETARQTLNAVTAIVTLAHDLENTVAQSEQTAADGSA